MDLLLKDLVEKKAFAILQLFLKRRDFRVYWFSLKPKDQKTIEEMLVREIEEILN
jgi:hypothetical protein